MARRWVKANQPAEPLLMTTADLPDIPKAAQPLIRPVAASERAEAVRKLMQRHGGASQQQTQYLNSVVDELIVEQQWVWGSYGPPPPPQGRLEAVALLVPQAGRTAMAFISPPVYQAQVPAMAALLDEACRRAPIARATLAQALVPPHASMTSDVFRAARFVPLATLRYMEMTAPRRAAQPPVPAGVTLEPWRDELRGDFLRAMDESYIQTLDCPGLQGMRRTDDVLAGHMSAGSFDPRMWTLLRVEAAPAGVLMLNPIPGVSGVELVYLGLGFAWRGRGLGRFLLRHALWQCAQRSQRTVMLAVDEANAPAVRLYEQTGFRGDIRKLALIRDFRTARGLGAE